MKDITIVVLDTYAHDLAKVAIEQTLKILDCKEVLVFSDKNIFPEGRWIEINPISVDDYNLIMLKNLWPFVRTDHILVIQYDGMAVNSDFWTDEFLEYDYIGAVWPWPHHPIGYKVGNGGFSLRSRRLLEILKDKRLIMDSSRRINEDTYIGLHYKDYLSSHGIKFAREKIATQFSHEHPPGFKQSFGFHGPFNIPYYFNEEKVYHFIINNPNWHSEGSALLAIHCCLTNKIDLAKLAMNVGCKSNRNFNNLILNTINTTPEVRQHANYKLIYEVLNDSR